MLCIPSSEVRRKRSVRRAAPSSMEYSVWTWRWTKSPPETAANDMDGEALLSGTSEQITGGRAGRTHRLDGPAGGRTPSLRDHGSDPDRTHRQPADRAR